MAETKKDTKVQSYGKFRYIEPNDILEDEIYDKEHKHNSFNTVHPYEDYCIDVELEVGIPNRGVWVTNVTNHVLSVETQNYNGSTISFFGGHEGNLTDTAGTFTYKDLLGDKIVEETTVNGKINKSVVINNVQHDNQSLGITSIHIGYNSYFYPEVTMQFTDIRGMGLMMPHEEYYRQTTITGTSKVEKFFAALFTFPYPEFKLRVKGFYGKKVEYSLVVSDFKSNFNNQTGNFEATVKFIGKMYGVYTDIPMSLLLLAPYCKYGSSEGKTIWERLNFQIEGKPMPTFLDLKKLVLESTRRATTTVSPELSEELQEIGRKRNALMEVKAAYTNFIEYVKNNHTANNEVIIHGTELFLFPHITDEIVGSDTNTQYYRYLYDGNTNLLTHTQRLFDAIKSFNSLGEDTIPYLKPLTERDKRIGGSGCTSFQRVDGTITDDSITWPSDGSVNFNISDYEGLRDILLSKMSAEADAVAYFVVNGIDLQKKITELENSIAAQVGAQRENIQEKAAKIIGDVLKFKPTIKNVFTILMAHLQAFVELMYLCIERIKNDNGRTIEGRGLTLAKLPDIPSNMTTKAHIPPFPAIKNLANNTFCYPTEANINGKLQETDLIDSIFVGSSDVRERNNQTDADETATNMSQNSFIPTCVSDFNCASYANPNPYSQTLALNEDNVPLNWIYTYFGMRCGMQFMMENNTSLTAEEFGAYEAYNFWLANADLDTNTVDILTNGSGMDSAKFIEYLTTTGTDTPRVYTDADKFTTLFETSDDKLSINNQITYNFPARIGHDNDFSQFKQDAQSYEYAFKKGKRVVDTYDSSFFGKTTFPYKLMGEIKESDLQTWNNKVTNYQNIPTESTKHTTIISDYLDPENDNNKHLFYWGSLDNIRDGQGLFSPAWSVLYQNVNTDVGNTFYKTFESSGDRDCFVKNYGNTQLFSLDTISNPGLHPSLTIHSINTIKQEPMFLKGYDYVTPGLFLSTIPHFILRLARQLRNGGRIIPIPYVTKLYIGYLMETLLNEGTSKEDFITKFRTIVYNAGAWSNRDNRPYLEANYTFNGIDDSNSYRYASYIKVILGFLSTNNNGEFWSFKYWADSDIVFNKTGVATSHKEDIEEVAKDLYDNRNRYKIDITGWRNEYNTWAESEDENFVYNGVDTGICGFKWLKNHMCLKERQKDAKFGFHNANGAFINAKGTSQLERLISIINQCKSKFTELSQDSSLQTAYEAAIDDRNPLLRYYVHMAEDDVTSTSFDADKNLAFSDVYQQIYCEKFDEDDIQTVYLRFNPNYTGTQKLDTLLKKRVYFIAPYQMGWYPNSNGNRDVRNNISVAKDKFTQAYDAFINGLKTLYQRPETEEEDERIDLNNVGYKVTTDSKLSMYRTLKNLYDKHFTNILTEKDKLYNIKQRSATTELNRFHFIDTYYNDLSDIMLFNGAILIDLLNTITDGYSNGNGEGIFSSEMSVYSFMSLLCQKHNMMLLAMPVFNGVVSKDSDNDNLDKMFVPLSYHEAQSEANTLHGPSYVCFYPHQASQHLEIPSSHYENDGLLITSDLNNTQSFEGPTTINALKTEGNYTIPSFGVEYGSQKQSVFKNINVNMDNPQVTEVSVANQFAIASTSNTDVRRLGFTGQDLFKIFSNYSYTCQVEMMGCAQIQPLMYFQLNNIPMFRGAYQIINVEHDITPGNMTTKFKGVRINKTNIPMVNQFLTLDLNKFLETYLEHHDSTSTSTDYLLHTLAASQTHVGDMTGHNQSTVTVNTILNDASCKDYIIFKTDEAKNRFNALNPSLRQLVYCLAKDMPNLSSLLGYKIGLRITETLRLPNEGGAVTSDHRRKLGQNNVITDDGFNGDNSASPKTLRDTIEGLSLISDGSGGYRTLKYSQMACAIDLCATKNGNTDKTGPSIQLFHHIVHHYNKYIGQLIWEVDAYSENHPASTADNISNIIHLGSYGENSTQNKGIIFINKKIKNSNGNFEMETITVETEKPDAYKTIRKKFRELNCTTCTMS